MASILSYLFFPASFLSELPSRGFHLPLFSFCLLSEGNPVLSQQEFPLSYESLPHPDRFSAIYLPSYHPPSHFSPRLSQYIHPIKQTSLTTSSLFLYPTPPPPFSLRVWQIPKVSSPFFSVFLFPETHQRFHMHVCVSCLRGPYFPQGLPFFTLSCPKFFFVALRMTGGTE